ncbi:MAG TPA: hypothetical protein VHG32_15290 [Thermoanaerobaculia bacterium]|jgi:hypothetical protein|nr:hypothetical protein [Thermoanaerobaculia bacterium]
MSKGPKAPATCCILLLMAATSSALQAANVGGGCTPSSTVLCVDNNPGDHRFKITATFSTSQGGGRSGNGEAISLSSLGVDHGGLFWFFSADNPELLIKVLNACASNGKFWVFYSAGTNVGFMVTVEDTLDGLHKTYTNPDLTPAAPVQDTSALSCPS